MSEWRARVANSLWRVRKYVPKGSLCGDVRYMIEAHTYGDGSSDGHWDQFAVIDMDIAGEGWGEDIAREIVESHNHKIAGI